MNPRHAHLVKSTAVLRDHVELLPQRREGPAVDRVRVCGAIDIGTCRVNGRMNHGRRLVQQRVRARLFDLHISVMVDEDEVAGLDQGEVFAL